MDHYEAHPEQHTVRFERLLPGPLHRVWLYLVESELRRTWLAGGDLDLSGAAPTEITFRHAEITRDAPPERYAAMHAQGHVTHWKVSAAEEPRLLRFLWEEASGTSEVCIELHPEQEQVRLILTHRRLKDRAGMAQVSAGWHAHLDVLAERLAGGEPAAFWKTVEVQEARYRAQLGV
jgi:uncharacterized protein YndB with AHSA1/START domain